MAEQKIEINLDLSSKHKLRFCLSNFVLSFGVKFLLSIVIFGNLKVFYMSLFYMLFIPAIILPEIIGVISLYFLINKISIFKFIIIYSISYYLIHWYFISKKSFLIFSNNIINYVHTFFQGNSNIDKGSFFFFLNNFLSLPLAIILISIFLTAFIQKRIY